MKNNHTSNKLKACRTYVEAEKVLETTGVGRGGKELLRLGFAVREKQPDIFDNNMATVIQEIEDDEEEKKQDLEAKETNDNTSHDSSTTGVTPQVADIAPHQDTEGMNSSTDTKDQLGAIVNEASPPYPGQMMPPQQGGMNQMPQQNAGGMGMPPQQGQQQPCPQNGMGMPQNPMQQQMQYTINQQSQMLNRQQEAIQTLSKKITELSRPAPQALDMSDVVGKTAGFSLGNPLKETTSPSLNTKSKDGIIAKSALLESTRRDIKSFNDFLHETKSD